MSGKEVCMTKKEEKSATKWGCPSCGSTDVVRIVTVKGKQDGRFDKHGRFVERDGSVRTDDSDVDDELGYECHGCGDTYEKPSRVYDEAGSHVRVSLEIDTFSVAEKGGPEGDTMYATGYSTELVCSSEEQARKMADSIKAAVAAVVKVVEGTGGG